MKKTLIALTVAAFAASSAHAFTAYQKDGTKFDLSGRLTFILDNVSTKTNSVNPAWERTNKKHSKLWNDGSRLRFDVTQKVNDDLKGFAALEMRFNRNADISGFGDAYALRAYGGLDSAKWGRVSIGKQLLIGDSIGRAGFDNVYGLGTLYGNILTKSADSSIEYTYRGIKGLRLSANYVFPNSRTSETDSFGRSYRDEVNAGAVKSGFGTGAIYIFDAGEGQASVALGYSHEARAEYRNGVRITDTRRNGVVTEPADAKKKDHDGVYTGMSYITNRIKVAFDYGYARHKTFGNWVNHLNYLRTGIRYNIPDTKAGVYTSYSYQTYKYKEVAGESKLKDVAHRFLFGADYKFTKNVILFAESRIDRVRLDKDKMMVARNNAPNKYTDRYFGLGLSVRW